MPNHPDKQKIKIIGFNHHNRYYNHHYLSSSSSSSYICHAVGPLVDPFQSHVSISVFKGLPRFLLPVGQYCFITLGNLFRGILFTWCILLLLYSSNLSKIGVTFNSFAICAFVCVCVCVCVCVYSCLRCLACKSHLIWTVLYIQSSPLRPVCRIDITKLEANGHFWHFLERALKCRCICQEEESILKKKKILLSSSSSSYICHGVGPLVDPFRSHVSRSLFKGLPLFLLPVGQ